MLPTQEENPKGLYNKYYIEKVNGELLDDNSEYFLLKLTGDNEHVKACKKAILTYAKEMKEHEPKLASDLVERYG